MLMRATHLLEAAASLPLRQCAIFLCNFKLICPVQSRLQKYSASRLTQITPTTPAIPSREEGRWPSSRTLGRVAVDAAASGAWSCSQGGLRSVSQHNVRTTGAEAYGKAVWSWHPLLVSSRRRKSRPNRVSAILQSAGDGGKRNSSPGRARYKPSNHCAGNAGLLRLYLYARVRFFAHYCTRDRGC